MPLQTLKFDREVQEFLEAASGDEELFTSAPEAFYEKYQSYLPSYPAGAYKKTLLAKIYRDRRQEEDEGVAEVYYSSAEQAFLASTENAEIRKILFCLLSWKKHHPHGSGWIKYDPWVIFVNLFTAQQIDKIVHSNRVAELVPYGFDMRVVGSKNPIVCYCLPELEGGEEFTEAEVREYVCSSDKSSP